MLLWIDKDMDWLAPGSGKRGRAEKFSDAAIRFCLMVKNPFGLALRQATGMVPSLLKRSGLDWPMPDYSTFCRRQQRLPQKSRWRVLRAVRPSTNSGRTALFMAQRLFLGLQVCISYRPNPNGLHLLVDSTGAKMLGEGEWKAQKHGAEYRRQWRKVHLVIDAETLEIRAIEVTSNRVGDAGLAGFAESDSS